ncbi:MAG: hypothetical protein Q6L68_12825 [Thermostichus sp. DG02_5_bins_236]
MAKLRGVPGFAPWIIFWILRLGVLFEVAAVVALVFSLGINGAAWQGQRLNVELSFGRGSGQANFG